MNAKVSQNQINLPGIDRDQYKYKALIEVNPEPADLDSARDFLRKHTDSSIKWRADHDFLRCILKDHDAEEEKMKYEKSAELPLTNKAEYERKVLSVAKAMYRMWLENEAPKQ